MKSIVTGGAGFIGSHIVDRLIREGGEVLVLDNFSESSEEDLNPNAEYQKVDIRDGAKVLNAFKSFKPHSVFHQAAQISVARSVEDPSYDASVNICGLLNCLKASSESDAERFIFASSGGCLYGETEEPAQESHPKNPKSPYGISKKVGEIYLKNFAASTGICSVSLRYSNVYGPRQNPNGEAGVVAIFAQKFIRGEEAFIFGAGDQVRDYVHVQDVARANELATSIQPPDRSFCAINVSSGSGTPVSQIAFLIHKAALARGLKEFTVTNKNERPGDLKRSVVSPEYAKKLLGWQPSVELQEGILQTFNWFYDKEKSEQK